MKILQYNEVGNRVLVSVLYEDNTFATLKRELEIMKGVIE